MERYKNLALKILSRVVKLTLLSIYLIFIIGLIAGGISTGIITLIPDEASKACYLGYYAHCSFAPFSTLILFAMATIGTFLLLKLVKYFKRQYKKVSETKTVFLNVMNK